MALSWFIKMCSNNPDAQYCAEFADWRGASDSAGRQIRGISPSCWVALGWNSVMCSVSQLLCLKTTWAPPCLTWWCIPDVGHRFIHADIHADVHPPRGRRCGGPQSCSHSCMKGTNSILPFCQRDLIKRSAAVWLWFDEALSSALQCRFSSRHI